MSEYVHVLLLIFPLIYFISPSDLFTIEALIVFSANLCLTAFGYIYNDLEDADDDYNDPKKRKRNPISSGEITKNQSIFVNLVLLSLGLYLLNLINSFVFVLGIIYAFVGFVYSWKTLRLKSKPILDLISHMLFLGVLQFLTTYVAFRELDLSIAPFLMIIIPISVMNEILHELEDYEIDRDTMIKNTVQSFERSDIKRFLLVLLGMVILGFFIIVVNLPPENRLFTIPFSLIVGSFTLYRMSLRTSQVSV
jgi:4-hydroxybenzoate polyprenyltransferase